MDEINQIEIEYGSDFFFKSFEIIHINDDKDIILNKSFIKLTTLEQLKYDIYITLDGWFSVNLQDETKSKHYPVFEGVANEISPKFNVQWNKKLIERLSIPDDDPSEHSENENE